MAQIVIFAPVGEDVSAGEKALKDAGHDVEIVEATTANLLHMAVGMLEEPAADKPAEEEPAEEPAAEEDPLAEPAAEEPTTEALGEITIDGEVVNAYLDASRSFPLLRVVDLAGDGKLSYSLHESTFSTWADADHRIIVELNSSKIFNTITAKVFIGMSTGRPHIILDESTAVALRLV